LRQSEWWRIGFLVSLANLAIWLGVGVGWWKLIGFW
jgi:DASS family divalent anion:Na+ symporter